MFYSASERNIDTKHDFGESFRNGKAFIEGKGYELDTPGGYKDWDWTRSLSDYLENPEPGYMTKQYGDISTQPLTSFAQMFGLDIGRGFEVISPCVDSRSIITLKRVGKGDFRFSSITEDGGITPDWYAQGESTIMKRLNQIYDKTK